LACHAGNDAFAVVLPESAHADAERLFRRLELAVDAERVDGDGSARLVAGIAELRHGETAAGLFERADSALYRAKEQGKDQASLAAD